MTQNLVFIGDSLTEWFDWQRRFPDYRTVNLGVSGETVEGLLARGERIRAVIDDPDVIFLMTGINNIAMERYFIADSYREIVRNLTTWYKRSTLVIQSILPVTLEWVSNNVIKDTNRGLAEIAQEFHAEYLDVYSLFIDSKGGPEGAYLQDDGVHVSSKGYNVWADEVERFLKR